MRPSQPGVRNIVAGARARVGRGFQTRTADPRLAPPSAADDLASTHPVLQLFRIIFHAVKKHFRQLERKAGVSGAEIWALRVIRQQPGIGIGAVARVLHVRQPTASILVKSLVLQDLIVVERLQSDRRAVALRVRPKENGPLPRVPGPYEEVLPAALGKLDGKTLATLERALVELIGRLGTGDRAEVVPSNVLHSD